MIDTIIGKDTKDLEPQHTTPAGTPPKRRMATAEAAYATYDKFKQADNDDARRRATLQGMNDGNPPYDPVRLEELGLGYVINVNFLEMRSILDVKASAAHELYAEVPTLIEVKQLTGVDPNTPAPNYGAIIAEEFTTLLFDWHGFLVNMDQVQRDSDLSGLGVALFTNEWDWRFKAFQRGCFLTNPRAKLDLDQLDIFYLRDELNVVDIYAAIENPELAKSAGWKVDETRELLRRVYLSGDNGNVQEQFQTSTWESVQQMIRNNDPLVQVKDFDGVKVVHMCVREADTGEITHCIFPDNASNKVFIFEAPRRYAKMSQVLWWLPYNYGGGFVRSVRGLASLLYPHCDLSNRFLGRVFDAGFLTSSLLLQPKTQQDISRLQLVKMGVVTIVPPELSAIQTSFTPQISSLVELREMSSALMRNNTGVYKMHDESWGENQVAKTARQVTEETTKEARLEKADVAHDYNHIEILYREIFRRVTRTEYVDAEAPYPGKEEAAQFIRRCVDRGVPRELLMDPKAFKIYATRAIGMGSWGVKLDITNQLLQIRPLLDEQGQITAIRDYVSARVGYRNVDKYKPLKNRDQIPSNEHSIATLENNDFNEGSNVPVGSDQTHTIHFTVHASLLQAMVQALQETQGQGIDLNKMLGILKTLLPHMEQHLQALSADPLRKQFVDTGVQVLDMGMKLFKQLSVLAEQQAKARAKVAQEQQQKLADADQVLRDRELEAKIYEIQRKYDVEKMKQDSLNSMRAEKTRAQMEIQRAKADESMRLNAERQSRELEMKAQVVDADIAMRRMESEESK